MAAIAAASAAFASLHHLSKPSSFIATALRHRHVSTVITSEFKITFAPPKPKPVTTKPVIPSESDSSPISDHQLFIPWIVRGEDGNLTLQTTPPESYLKAMAREKTKNSGIKNTKTKKKSESVKSGRYADGNDDGGDDKTVASKPPKYSKAARRFYNERFREQPQRIAKVLASAGVASRRSCEELIFQGKVTVNGSVCKEPQTRVDPAQDIIYVNGSRLAKKLPPKVYLALNKPKGYICSAGEKETKSVLSLFDDYMKSWDKRHPGIPKPRLFTVGRLDVATTGLIIVTNDGEFAQKASHPSSNLSKEYIATVNGAVSKRHLIAISEGAVIEGVHCIPDSVELLQQQPDISRPRLRIVVHEGRNHEVRELVKNAGLQIHALKRIRIGGFRLPTDLALGKHVELSSANLRALGWKN